MADERALKIARIQRIERIKELEAKNANAFPGAEAAGVTEGPTPKGMMDTAKEGLGVAAKVLDAPRGLLTGPAVAQALQALTGKQAASWKEWEDAANPTNLKTFPSTSEMMERVGVPEGAQLSNYIPGYGEPGSSPWYQPEKGGMLDFTLRGAGGFGVDVATDPLNWLSLGAAGAAKRAAAETASKAALANAGKKGVLTKAGELAARPLEAGAEKLTPLIEKLKNTKAGQVALTAAQAPSRMLKNMGKGLYAGTVQAVEHEGEKFGKFDTANTLYDAGIKTPFGLRKKAEDATNVLINARNKILKEADEAGAQVSMKDAMAGAREKINELRSIKDADAAQMADQLEAKLNEYELKESGTAAIPETTRQVETQTLGADYKPVMKTEVIPGKEAIPGTPFTTEDATKLKSFLYEGLPSSTFHQNLQTPRGARIRADMARGIKEGTENAVASELGIKAGADVANLNAEAGKLLSTRKAQTRVSNQADRVANNLRNINGAETYLATVGELMHEGEGGGLTSLALKKLLDAIRLGTMPAGYAARKAGESILTAPVIDAVTRNKFKKYAGYGPRGIENGEEK